MSREFSMNNPENKTLAEIRAEAWQQGREEAIKQIEQGMYNAAFVEDHKDDGLQKWDGGNWIRYKLFENVIERVKGQKNGKEE